MTGAFLSYFAIESLGGTDSPERVRVVLGTVEGIAGILLIIGLWTPIAGVIAAIVESWVLISRPFSEQSHPFAHIIIPVLAISLALLGPGAWSLDARLFGRKLVVDGVSHRGSRHRL